MILEIALGLGAFYILTKKGGTLTKLYDLPDIEPENQGGVFKRDFDTIFETVSGETGVPFALLKAHAIAESSLNPNAFLDESGGRTDRIGWASRGLMQILWAPGMNHAEINADRWKKYGYPGTTLGASGERQFEPYINVKIAGLLIRDNLHACKGNIRDAVNMYNTGRKESQYKAPNNYVGKVLGYYATLIKGSVS